MEHQLNETDIHELADDVEFEDKVEFEEWGVSEESQEIPKPDLSVKLAPGEVRAGRITKEEELIGGRTAKGRIGDYKIYNSKVAFIIQDAGLSSGYKRFGGLPVDADIAREKGEKGQSQLGELFFGFNQRVFEPLEVEVVNDGLNGERAIIRVSGRDALFPWLASFLSDILPMETINCDLTFDYSLGPDDEALQIDIGLKNNNEQAIEISMNKLAMIMGDGLKSFLEGVGFDESKFKDFFDHWLALGDSVSYGFLAKDGAVNIFGSYMNATLGLYPSFTIGAGETRYLRRYLIVTQGGISEVQRVIRQIKGENNTGTVKGSVNAPSVAHEKGIRIHVLRDDGAHYSLIKPDKSGNFQAELPPGKYNLIAKSDGFEPSAPVDILLEEGGTAEDSLELSGSIVFEYLILEKGKGKTPAKIAFFRSDAPQKNIMPAMYGEERYPMNAALVIHSHDGAGTAILPAGEYIVYASRGNEYEIEMKEFDLFESDQSIEFILERSVETSGYLSGDFHIHTEHSPDSSITEELRVKTALAENLELLVITDHDTIRDLSKTVEALGVGSEVKAVAGSEVTTYIYGHFNAFPLTEKPDQLNNGGIEWFDTTAPELFEKIRKSEKHKVIIQVCHPRSPSMGGYFNAVGLDIEKGEISEIHNWSDNFDAIEVFNGGCLNGNREELLDWFDFLNRGYRFSVSGGSDSHSEFAPVGIPKIYIKTHSSVADFSLDELVENFLKQQVFISCGPFVRFSINGAEPGETVAYNGELLFDVEVQAASWMKLKEMNIIRNGEIVFTLPSDDWKPKGEVLRFHDTFTLEADGDAWYLLEIKGVSGFYPIAPEIPYAITSPVYLDFDGNGSFDPPLPKYGL